MTRPLRLALAAAAVAGLIGPARAQPPTPTDDERQALRELTGKLTRGRHPAIRSSAASSLGAMGPRAESAVPALVNALKDRDSSVSSAAAAALGKVGVDSKAAVTGLVGALAHGREPVVKASAAEALGRIGLEAAGAAPQLVLALDADDGDLRREAAFALGRLGPKAKPAIPRLEALLDDGEARVRLCAAISLTRLEHRAPALAAALAAGVPRSSGTPVELREVVCEALGDLGPAAAGAVTALVGALGEAPDINPALPYVVERQAAHDAMRRAAAAALGRIGDPAAAGPLERATGVPALEEAAREALARLGA